MGRAQTMAVSPAVIERSRTVTNVFRVSSVTLSPASMRLLTSGSVELRRNVGRRNAISFARSAKPYSAFCV